MTYLWLKKPYITMWQWYPFFVSTRSRVSPVCVYKDLLTANNSWSKGKSQEEFNRLQKDMFWCVLAKPDNNKLPPAFHMNFFFPNEHPSLN